MSFVTKSISLWITIAAILFISFISLSFVLKYDQETKNEFINEEIIGNIQKGNSSLYSIMGLIFLLLGILTFLLIKKMNELSLCRNEIQEAKKSLKRQKDILFKTINDVPAFIGYWDKNLKNVYSNLAYSEYFGKSPDEIKGIHIKDLLGNTLFQKNYPYVKAALEGTIQTFEREIPLPSGNIKHTVASYIPDIENDEIQGFFVVAKDITEIKKMENELQEIELKLISASKMSSLGQMSGEIAHEINTPLGLILIISDQIKALMEEKDLNKQEVIKATEIINSTVERMSKIIDGLLKFARDSDLEKTQIVYVKALIDDVLSFCHERFKNNGITLNISPIANELTLQGKHIELSQVLLNLLNNAFDAVCHLNERWVSLTVIDTLETVEFSITDSGNGISIELRDKIMKPFFTTKPLGKGTGIGLSLSKEIVERHQGSLFFDEKSEKTKFVIHLPKRQKVNLNRT